MLMIDEWQAITMVNRKSTVRIGDRDS